jgi:hypothetical protein
MQAEGSPKVDNRQSGSNLRAEFEVSGAVDQDPPIQSSPTSAESRRFATTFFHF